MREGTLAPPRIEQLMLELADRLKIAKGKKQYGYLQKPLKNLVDKIVDEVEKDPRVAAAYGFWYQLREEVLRTYRDDMPKRVGLSRQQEFKRIKNLVIGEAIRLEYEAASFSPSDDAETEGPLPDSPPPENEPPEADSDEPVFEMPPRIVWSTRYKEARSLLHGKRNTPPDSDKAYTLMLAEAQSSNALAMFNLGRMFADGIGKAIDPGRAQAGYAQALAAFQTVEQTWPNRYAEYRIGQMFASEPSRHKTTRRQLNGSQNQRRPACPMRSTPLASYTGTAGRRRKPILWL